MIIASRLAVNTYLFLGGFLLAYSLQRAARKSPMFPYVVNLPHRLLRVYPTAAVALFLWWFIVPLCGSGPLWSTLQTRIERTCSAHWVSSLFLVSNLTEGFYDQCYEWLWWGCLV